VRHTEASSETVRFNSEARRTDLRFATSPEAIWSGNFRELSASITRMATLADGGRITEHLVEAEIARLRDSWADPMGDALRGLLP
jgi:transcriptional regulatory protein RtcR